MRHTLVLDDSGVARAHWLARCSCSWAGRPTRRRCDAAKQYRRHLVIVASVVAKRSFKPRRPTPAALLPVDLQPKVVTFS